MKRYSLFATVTIVSVWFWSTPAAAVLNIYEPFDYATGPLQGNTNTSAGTTANGNLWQRAGTGNPPAGINVTSGSLTGPSEILPPIGNSLSFTPVTSASGAMNRLALDQDYTSGTLYYSFLLNVTDLSSTNNVIGAFFFSLNNSPDVSQTNNPTVVPGKVQIRIDPEDDTKYNLGIFGQAAATAESSGWATNQLDMNTTQMIVGSLNLGTKETRLWINPDPGTFGLATAPAFTANLNDTTGWSGNNIRSVLVRQTSVTPSLTMDELRVGGTWADVTPIQALYWDLNGNTAGAGGATPSGTWDASSNWSDASAGDVATVAWAPGVKAVFSAGDDATGSYTVTVSGTQSVSGITFEDGTITLTGGTLQFAGPAGLNVADGRTATIESQIDSSNGLNKAGTGTLILNTNQAYTGTTNITGGTLQIGDGGTAGALSTSSPITSSGGTVLRFNRSNDVVQGTDFSGDAIAGAGGVTQAGSSTLTLNAANTHTGSTRTESGTILLTHAQALQNSILNLDGADTGAVVFDSSLSAATVGALAGSRNMVLENGASTALALTVGNNTGVYSGNLSGAGSLTKSGTGAQAITGDNTYTGGTTINSGSLRFGKTFSMPAGGDVIANSGGTLTVSAGGTDEWTDSTDDSVGGTIASIIKGRGGRGTADQVTWMSGSALGIDTSGAPADVTYNGVIGGFRTTGGGTTEEVGITKRGAGTLILTANNTFSGPITVEANAGRLELSGTNDNAGSTMAIPTVTIGASGTLRENVSDAIPSTSLIHMNGGTSALELGDGVTQHVRSVFGQFGQVRVGRFAGDVSPTRVATLYIDDQAGDDYVLGNFASGTASLRTSVDSKIYKTGEGTLTLSGNTSSEFEGEFIMQNGVLKLSNGQALTGTGGRLTVEGGWLSRSNTPTGNYTYGVSNVNAHVFRYDLGADQPNRISQFGAGTVTTLKEDNVEFEITNTPDGTGRLGFVGLIRNHDPSPFGGDDPNAIRGITKLGNGDLRFHAATTYKGSTTIQEGRLSITDVATLGDYNEANIGTLFLKGGTVATTQTRPTPIKNPIVVDGHSGISSIAAQTTVLMEFDTDSVVGTSGSISITNENTANNTSIAFQPRFSGSGFDFGLPISIAGPVLVGTGTKSSELQGGNASGTQTFSGDISGGGSFRRVNAGGTTVLSGNNSYSGGTTVESGTLTVSGASATLGTGAVTVTGGTLDIASSVANAIADAATLSISGTGLAALGAGINEFLAGLVLDGIAQGDGTYGSSSSSATFQFDQWFSGDGILTVAEIPTGLPGDYNEDNVVDARDYVVWRKMYGSELALPNDDTAGVGDDDYDRWVTNFGATTGGGGGGDSVNGAVPEPSTVAMALLTLFAVGAYRRRSA